jgi:hypothetical protein
MGEKAGDPVHASTPFQINREAFSRLAGSLGLPQDTLSSALLAFSRYFSLPLDPELLLKLRGNVLALMETRTAKYLSPKTFRDAAVLASAAAADKGVELSPEALERYAEALDPESRDSPDGGEERRRQRPGFQEDEVLEPENIRQKAGEIEANEPLLGILNRIPGKDGRHWVALPFTFHSEGIEFKISIRIVLKEYTISENKVERLAVDVSSESRRWLFIMDKPGTPGARIDISVYPPLEAARFVLLEGEIRGLLKEFAGSVRLWNNRDEPPFGADSRNEVLLSIDEEV